MRFITRLWRDFRKGESIDLVATILVSIVAIICDLFGFIPDTLITSLTLTVLLLISLTSIVNRHRVEDLTSIVSNKQNEFFGEEFPGTLKNHLETAAELWVIGISLSRTIKTYYSVFEQKLREGYYIRVLLVHPEGASVEMAATRYYARRDSSQKAIEIKNSLELLCELRNTTRGKIDIRTTMAPISHGVLAVNPNTASGVLYIENYPFRIVSESVPKYVLRAQDGRWYEFFKRESEILWDSGQNWKCEDNISINSDNKRAKKTFFREDFSSGVLDDTLWFSYQNEGRAYVRGGTLVMECIEATTSFPYIYTRREIIPQEEDFAIKVCMKFLTVGPHGTGFVLTSKFPSNSSNEETSLSDWYRIWSDVSQRQPGGLEIGRPDQEYHEYEFRWNSNSEECYVDGKLIESHHRDSNRPRPKGIRLGNFFRTSTANKWTSYQIQYIEVVVL